MHFIKHELDLKLGLDSNCDRGKVQMVLDVTLHNPSPLSGSRCPLLSPRSSLIIPLRLICAIWFLIERRGSPNIPTAFGKRERTKAPPPGHLLCSQRGRDSHTALPNLLRLGFAKPHARITPCFTSPRNQVDKLGRNKSLPACGIQLKRGKESSSTSRGRPGHQFIT